MPLFYYTCAKCAKTTRKILSKPEVSIKCECGHDAERSARGGSSMVMESLDNGVMTKKLERLADAERLFHERVAKGDKPDSI